MTEFSTDALEESIEKADKNILIFEEAIRKERAAQKEFRMMIKESKRMEEKRNVVQNGVQIEAEQDNNTNDLSNNNATT